MKKISYLFLSFFMALVGCSNTSSSTIENNNVLIFSEFLVMDNYANRAVEITNISEETINLENYYLNIYKNVSLEATYQIPLQGQLASKEAYVITHSEASEEIKAKANLIDDNFINAGNWAMSISYLEENIDILGKIGYSYRYATEKDLVRKEEYYSASLEFNADAFVAYPNNQIDHLGNLDVIKEEELLKGPKLSEEFFNAPFTTNGTTGDGGVIKSKVTYYIDGDTSYFAYGNKYKDLGISGELSTRYYGINTPEISHRAGESSDPYGDEAKEFTNAHLKAAKSILLQSVKDYSLHETYGRMLAFIWISDLENASYSDYQLLNFLIIKEGYSKIAFTGTNRYPESMMDQGLTYIDFLEAAENYASAHKLNIHSGV